jgi:acyl carrier protein
MREEIKKYIEDVCLLGEKEVGYDEPLLESGTLDSLNFLNLLGFVQKTYGVFINMNEIRPDQVDTVNEIAAMVDRYKKKEKG